MFDSNISNQIRVPKTAELLAARVRKAIVRGDLKPGDKLPPEADLITEFEVSRPTIREAIRILEFEGLITVSRGARGGARVNAPSGDVVTRAAGLALQARGATLGDIYTARTLIEPHAARLAAELNKVAAAAALRTVLYHARAVAQERTLLARAVAEFHRVLLAESGNVALSVVGQALQDIVERHIQLAYVRGKDAGQGQSRKTTELGLRSQEKLIELIEAGNGAEAEAHWVRHMENAGKVVVGELAGTAIIEVLE